MNTSPEKRNSTLHRPSVESFLCRWVWLWTFTTKDMAILQGPWHIRKAYCVMKGPRSITNIVFYPHCCSWDLQVRGWAIWYISWPLPLPVQKWLIVRTSITISPFCYPLRIIFLLSYHLVGSFCYINMQPNKPNQRCTLMPWNWHCCTAILRCPFNT